MVQHATLAAATYVNSMLTNLLERLVTIKQPNRPRTEYNALTFDGKGNVDYFALHFLEVSTANEWNKSTMLLHLKETLKDEATTTPAVFEVLRTRYGISPRKARRRLNTLEKKVISSLQEHAIEVQRLVSLGYAEPTKKLSAQNAFRYIL